MNRSHNIAGSMLIVLMMLGSLNAAQADNDHIKARQLRDAGKILPLETILENARQSYPGKILEVELEKEKNRIVYEVEILGNDGIVREIYIDASTGELLFAKEDD